MYAILSRGEFYTASVSAGNFTGDAAGDL
jgi:hypothetical protein